MSEPKLISPMLDGFLMGAPMSSRQGVQCCPAMPKDSDKRYIVKIISIPESQVQLDALLLTGAYASEEAALAYFKELADKTVEEVQILKRLSAVEGFEPYESYQIVRKEGETGYQVYLLGTYKHSLDRQLRRHTMTHLNAVNLGLDMCASMAVCRRAGYLYVDLKPENIFMGDDGEFRVGDIGFVRLDSLKFTSLDDQYHSPYTPPEAKELFSTVNETIDTYGAGMILYQTYNDGKLPVADEDDTVPPPEYADYEMAEIIMKAIDRDPAKRWKSPMAMGHALVAYMQKNGANDVPIVPASAVTPNLPPVDHTQEDAQDAPEEAPDAPEAAQQLQEQPAEESTDELQDEAAPPDADAEAVTDELQDEAAPRDADAEAVTDALTPLLDDDVDVEELMALLEPLDGQILEEETSDTAEKASQEAAEADRPEAEQLQDAPGEMPEESPLQDEEAPAEASSVAEAATDEASAAQAPSDEPAPQTDGNAEDIAQEEEDAAPLDPDDPANLAFMQTLAADETTPSEDMAEDIDYGELSDETSHILAQADELLLHETPGGVVPPDPIDVPIPPPIVLQDAEAEPRIDAIEADFQPDSVKNQDNDDQEADNDYTDEDDYEDYPPSNFSLKKLIAVVLIVVLLAAACFGGYYYYKEYYLQTISTLNIRGQENALTIELVSDVDEKLLTAVCTDTYGTKRTSAITNGSASFTGLNPDTLYTVSIEIQGFHKLIGPTTGSYTTPKQTNIISFNAVAGTVDGSATLRFKVDGQNTNSWKVVYSAEGEETRIQEFTDNVVTVTGLTVGKTYTFQLQTDSQLYIVGNDTLQYTVMALVEAQDLQITSCSDGKLTANWKTPEGKSVNSWTVRCYNESGYDQTLTTPANSIEFQNLDTTQAYTVEVTAEGMTSASRAFVSANSVTVTSPKADTSDPTRMVLSWDYSGITPEGEWLVLYTVDGSDAAELARTSTNSVVISPMVPGATYDFTIQTQSGVTLFGGEFSISTPAAPTFDNYLVETKDLKFTMCETPAKADWVHKDVTNETDKFKIGQKASFKVVLYEKYNTSQDEITILYVIRNKDNKLIFKDSVVSKWIDMWYIGMCELDVPRLPEVAGRYTIEIYFNGRIVHNQSFTIS